MKVKDFVKLLDTASSDAEIKIENGEIVITEPKPIKYKYWKLSAPTGKTKKKNM